jgi:ATP-binding cassette subfamily C protein CydC
VKSLRRLLRLARPQAGSMAMAVGLGALTVGSGIALMSTSAYLISAAALLPSVAELQVAIVGVRFFGISRGVFRYLERLASHSASLKLLADLRAWFYAALEPLAPARLQREGSGDLLSRAVSDIDSLQDFFVRSIAPPLVALLVAAGFGIFLGFFSPILALAALGVLAVVGVAIPGISKKLGRVPGIARVSARARLTQAIVDGVQGLDELLANNAAGAHLRNVAEASDTLAGAEGQLAWRSGLHSALSSLGANLGGWLVLLLAIPIVAAGQLRGMDLAVVVLGTLAAFEAVNPLAQAAQALDEQLAAADRLFDLVDAEPPVAEPSQPVEMADNSDLSIQSLTFGYEKDTTVLHELSLELPTGHKAAILGASGVGKSTLLNLLHRFWDYKQGEILLGGVELRKLPTELVRAQFAVVPQRVHIFNNTLEENLRIAGPEASQQELEAAARGANLLDFIEAQPEAWATWAGEHGLRLSGGERQRLGVARALLRNAPILLLDEFTTHLDPGTARVVIAETLAAVEGRSVLWITHAAADLSNMDAVYELVGGQLKQIA